MELSDNGVESRESALRYWLICRRDELAGVEALTVSLPGGEKLLPLFRSEAEAGMFLWLEALEEVWRVRETSVGELISVLCGPCADVHRVILDPLASGDAERDGVERRDFVRDLLGERGSVVARRYVSQSGVGLEHGGEAPLESG